MTQACSVSQVKPLCRCDTLIKASVIQQRFESTVFLWVIEEHANKLGNHKEPIHNMIQLLKSNVAEPSLFNMLKMIPHEGVDITACHVKLVLTVESEVAML